MGGRGSSSGMGGGGGASGGASGGGVMQALGKSRAATVRAIEDAQIGSQFTITSYDISGKHDITFVKTGTNAWTPKGTRQPSIDWYKNRDVADRIYDTYHNKYRDHTTGPSDVKNVRFNGSRGS